MKYQNKAMDLWAVWIVIVVDVVVVVLLFCFPKDFSLVKGVETISCGKLYTT